MMAEEEECWLIEEATRTLDGLISSLWDAAGLDRAKREAMRKSAKEDIGKLKLRINHHHSPEEEEESSSISVSGFSASGVHPRILSAAASDAFEIVHDDAKGRHAVATKDIEAGTLLVAEEPVCASLNVKEQVIRCSTAMFFMMYLLSIKCSIRIRVGNWGISSPNFRNLVKFESVWGQDFSIFITVWG